MVYIILNAYIETFILCKCNYIINLDNELNIDDVM